MAGVTSSTRYTNPATASSHRKVAKRVQQFRATYHRDPTDFEFYGLWNAPGQVLEGRISKRVAERCRRYAICEWTGAPTITASRGRPAATRAAVPTELSRNPAI
jgi:hypothetical protein